MSKPLEGIPSKIQFGEGGSLHQEPPTENPFIPQGYSDALARLPGGLAPPPCEHPSETVVADILEGDGAHVDIQVQWCTKCGAVRPVSAETGQYLKAWRVTNA